MPAGALASFTERFEMVLTDLKAMPRGVTILAEGWGLRPDLVAPLIETPARSVFLVPTEAYRQQQIGTLARAGQFVGARVSDPERAQRNRTERDRLLALDVVDSAGRLGLPVILVDGNQGVPGLADLVERQFRPFLPSWLYESAPAVALEPHQSMRGRRAPVDG
ncbi:MAG: hypothetical protein ACR2PL_04575 [Dehalococcoidia bacterium]